VGFGIVGVYWLGGILGTCETRVGNCKFQSHMVEKDKQVAHVGLDFCDIMEKQRCLVIVISHEVNQLLQYRFIKPEVHLHIASTAELQLLRPDQPP